MRFKMTNDVMIALSLLKGIGPVFIRTIDFKIYQGFSDRAIIMEDILSKRNKVIPRDEIYAAIDKAVNIIERSREIGLEIINSNDKLFPTGLLDLKDCPPILFLRGNQKLLSQEIIAIVGTRKPDSVGTKIASKLGLYFRDRGWIVCNGLADGIDTFSVQFSQNNVLGAIGVLGGGLDIYETKTVQKNTQILAAKVLENNGLLISENITSKKEDPYSLIKACRIQAAISKGVILVQSDISGGSRFTLKAAVESSKPIGIVVPPPQYYSSRFEANIRIFREKEQGLQLFTEVNNKFQANIKLVFIESSEDYEKMVRFIT